MKTGKDLTKEAPRSPHTLLGGYAVLPRTIDKCRALLWGNVGEYHFDCPVDNSLFGFKDIKGDDFKAFVEEGHTDEEILAWVNKNGFVKTPEEIAEWTKGVFANNMEGAPAEKKGWLEGENIRVGLDKNDTLFNMLDADDKMTFKK